MDHPLRSQDLHRGVELGSLWLERTHHSVQRIDPIPVTRRIVMNTLLYLNVIERSVDEEEGQSVDGIPREEPSKKPHATHRSTNNAFCVLEYGASEARSVLLLVGGIMHLTTKLYFVPTPVMDAGKFCLWPPSTSGTFGQGSHPSASSFISHKPAFDFPR